MSELLIVQHFPEMPVFSTRPQVAVREQGGDGDDQSRAQSGDRRKVVRPKNRGNRVLMFGRIRELALYRAAVLRDRGFDVLTPADFDEAVGVIRRGGFDIAVLTYTLSNNTVRELAELIREYCPECPLIAISSSKRVDREINPNEIVLADEGPSALLAALRRVARPN